MNMPLKIKIYSSSKAEFVEMKSISESLSLCGHEIDFVNLETESLIPTGHPRKVSFIDNQWADSSIRRVYLTQVRLKRSVKRLLYPVVLAIQFYRVWKIFCKTYQAQVQSFRVNKCDIVILPEMGVGYIWPLVAKACRNADIPIVIFPFTICNQEEPIKDLCNTPEYLTKNNLFFLRYFKKWRFKQDDIDILRLPSALLCMHHLFGVVPTDPWHYLSGEVDMIVVDSDFTMDYFLNSGVDEKVMKVLGSPIQDRIWMAKNEKLSLKQAFIIENDLNPAKPIFLISGCPNQFGPSAGRCEFESMESLADFLSKTLKILDKKFNVVIRPHPNFRAFYDFFDPKFFTLSDLPTYELIPLSDCFFAFASATIRWALFAGVPVINYDPFGYDFSDYKGQDGVEHVKNKKELRLVIDAIASSDIYLLEKVKVMNGRTSLWGVEGGNNLKKINETIQSCANKCI